MGFKGHVSTCWPTASFTCTTPLPHANGIFLYSISISATLHDTNGTKLLTYFTCHSLTNEGQWLVPL